MFLACCGLTDFFLAHFPIEIVFIVFFSKRFQLKLGGEPAEDIERIKQTRAVLDVKVLLCVINQNRGVLDVKAGTSLVY